jgi:hypothetical protein
MLPVHETEVIPLARLGTAQVLQKASDTGNSGLHSVET